MKEHIEVRQCGCLDPGAFGINSRSVELEAFLCYLSAMHGRPCAPVDLYDQGSSDDFSAGIPSSLSLS